MTDLNYDHTHKLKSILPADAIAEIDSWIAKYPADRKRPPIIPALKVVQDHHGNYLTEDLMQAVAEYLEVPRVAVFEVATFYSMFHLSPMGKHVISVVPICPAPCAVPTRLFNICKTGSISSWARRPKMVFIRLRKLSAWPLAAARRCLKLTRNIMKI